MLHEAEKEVVSQKLLVFNLLAQVPKENAEFRATIMETWNRFLSLTYGIEIEKAHSFTEKSMMDEYEKIKHLRPEFKLEKDGKITIKGFESFQGKT